MQWWDTPNPVTDTPTSKLKRSGVKEMVNPMNMRRAFTVQQVADMYAISKGKVYRMIESGELGCLRFGRSVRVRPEHIEDYEENQCHSASLNDQKSTANNPKHGMSSGRKTDAHIDIRLAKRIG